MPFLTQIILDNPCLHRLGYITDTVGIMVEAGPSNIRSSNSDATDYTARKKCTMGMCLSLESVNYTLMWTFKVRYEKHYCLTQIYFLYSRQIGRAAFIVNLQLTFAPHFHPVYQIWMIGHSSKPHLDPPDKLCSQYVCLKSFKQWLGGNYWITAFTPQIQMKNQVGKDGRSSR